MKMTALLPIVAAIVVVVSLMSIWFFPSFQDLMASNAMWNGISQFRQASGATLAESLASPLPEKGTLLTIPYARYSAADLAVLKRFVSAGGLLIVADDFGHGNAVLASLDVSARFAQQPLIDPLFCYRDPHLPVITDFSSAVEGVREVLLNHPTALTGVSAANVIAWSSPSSYLDADGDGVKDRNEAGGPFPVAARLPLGNGSVALVADPSIITNAAVARFDNYAFVASICRDQPSRAIVIDDAHLGEGPLDVSKEKFSTARKVMSNPYALVGVVAAVLGLSAAGIVKKGEALEHKGRE